MSMGRRGVGPRGDEATGEERRGRVVAPMGLRCALALAELSVLLAECLNWHRQKEVGRLAGQAAKRALYESTKEAGNRIKSAKKRRPPAMLPTLVITSARSFSLSCNGVFSESRRKATSQSCQQALNEGENK